MLKSAERQKILLKFDRYKWQRTSWTLSNGAVIVIVHNLEIDLEKKVNEADKAFQEWVKIESPLHLNNDRLCAYINKKRTARMGDFWAMLTAEWMSLKQDFNSR